MEEANATAYLFESRQPGDLEMQKQMQPVKSFSSLRGSRTSELLTSGI